MLTILRLVLSLAVVLSLWPAGARAQSRAGVVTNLQGTATATRRPLPQPVALKFRDDVFQNDRIVTGDRSLVRLLLGGKAVVTIRERSALTITEIPGKSTINLDDGKIAVAVARDRMRPGEQIEVKTPNAIAAVRGTTFVVEVSRATAQAGGGATTGVTTIVSCFSGLTYVSYGARPFAALPSGQASTGSGNQPPTIGPMTPEQRQQALAGLETSGQALPGSQNAAIDSVMSSTALTMGLLGDLPTSGFPPRELLTAISSPTPTPNLLPGGGTLPGGGEDDQQPPAGGGGTPPPGVGFKPANTPTGILVFGDYPSRNTLATDLAGLRPNVLLMNVQTLPADVSMFGTIFHVSAFVGLTAAEQAELRDFLASGRGLHLTGERPCCEVLNDSLTSFVRSLVGSGADIIIGGRGDIAGPYTFNPSAAGGITTSPNALTTWTPSAPGGLSGVSGANVLVTGAGSVPVGAVWDSGDLVGGSGRLTLLMDVNWFDNPGRIQVIENLLQFIDDVPALLTLAGPLFTSTQEQLDSPGTFLLVQGYGILGGGQSPLLSLSGTRVTVPRFLEMADSAVVAGGSLARLDNGAEIVQASAREPLVSMRGGSLDVGVGGQGHLFDLQGHADHTQVDGDTGLVGGADRPLQPGAESPLFSATDGAVVTASGSAVHVDTALLEATAPLVAMATGASMTTGGHSVDLVAKARVSLANDAVALVNLDRSTLSVLNGHLVNVTGGSSLAVAGSLVALANGSTLNILNGLLLNVSGGSSASISGSLVSFTGTGNVVSVSNNLLPTAIISGIPVAGPVDSLRIAGINALSSGTGQGTITVNGVMLTPTTPLSSLSGSLVTVQSGSTVKIGN